MSCHDIILEHVEISRLNGETGRIIHERAQLRKINTKTEEEIQKLRDIETELRKNVNNLLTEIENQEKTAEATNEELRQNVAALAEILESRDADLIAESEKVLENQAKNVELVQKFEDAEKEIEELEGDFTNAKAEFEQQKETQATVINGLKVKIAELSGVHCVPVLHC